MSLEEKPRIIDFESLAKIVDRELTRGEEEYLDGMTALSIISERFKALENAFIEKYGRAFLSRRYAPQIDLEMFLENFKYCYARFIDFARLDQDQELKLWLDMLELFEEYKLINEKQKIQIIAEAAKTIASIAEDNLISSTQSYIHGNEQEIEELKQKAVKVLNPYVLAAREMLGMSKQQELFEKPDKTRLDDVVKILNLYAKKL